MHPFVHAFNPAIAPPWQTRTDFDAFHAIAAAFSRWPRSISATRQDMVAVPLTHDTPDELADPRGVVRDWRAASASRCPGAPCRSSSWSSATTARWRRRWPRSARCWTGWAPRPRRSPSTSTPRSTKLREINGVVRGGVADGRPAAGPRHARVRGDPGAVGHDQRPRSRSPGFEALERRTGQPAGGSGRRARGQAHPLRRHPGPAGAGHHQPGVVGQRDTAGAATRRSRSTSSGSSPGTP